MKRLHSRGFTIIELLISTAVFSCILLIVTGVIIQISNIYYKGVVNTKTQEVARTVLDELTKKVQYSGGAITTCENATNGMVTIGNSYYIFKKNQVVGATNHALVASGSALSCSPSFPTPPAVLASGQTELLVENTQLRYLKITQQGTSSSWKIDLTIAYGNNADLSGVDDATTCRFSIRLGGQFCSIANYSTTVTRRL